MLKQHLDDSNELIHYHIVSLLSEIFPEEEKEKIVYL